VLVYYKYYNVHLLRLNGSSGKSGYVIVYYYDYYTVFFKEWTGRCLKRWRSDSESGNIGTVVNYKTYQRHVL